MEEGGNRKWTLAASACENATDGLEPSRTSHFSFSTTCRCVVNKVPSPLHVFLEVSARRFVCSQMPLYVRSESFVRWTSASRGFLCPPATCTCHTHKLATSGTCGRRGNRRDVRSYGWLVRVKPKLCAPTQRRSRLTGGNSARQPEQSCSRGVVTPTACVAPSWNHESQLLRDTQWMSRSCVSSPIASRIGLTHT